MLSAESADPKLEWTEPKVDDLVDLLTYMQNWEPSYVRQHIRFNVLR